MTTKPQQNNQNQPGNQAKKRDSDRVTWFRHNIDASSGRRFQMLRIAGGYEAHGIYWALMEPLYKYGNRYPLANAMQMAALASELHITVQQLESTIKNCIECENLLDLTDGILSCDRVEEELERACNISEKRRNAARLGGIAKGKQTAKHKIAKPATLRNVTIRNETKEKKKRESKLSLPAISAPPTQENPKLPEGLQSWFLEQGYIEAAPNVWMEPGVLERIRGIPNFEPYVDEALELMYRWSISHDISQKTNKPGWYTYRLKRDHRATLLNQIKRIKQQDAA